MRIARRSLLAGVTSALAGCAPPPGRAQVARSIDADRAARHVPGAAVAFVRRGATDVLEGCGDVATTTPLEVASLSKPVFAFAVVAESTRGPLDLDAPLARIHPPPYRHVRRGAIDAFDDPRLPLVTPRLLLSHRAGLPNWSLREPLSLVERPGESWRYSGEGYALLQQAIESARGESLDAFVGRAVFAPLGMKLSTFEPGKVHGRAAGHDRAGAAVESSLDAENAASSLISTVSDYARFVRRLVEAPRGDAVVEAMLAHQVDVDAERRISWGLGLALAAPEWFFHWGANPGFRSLLVGSRRRGEGVVVLTSSEGGMELAADVVRARFGELPLLGFPLLYPPD